MKLSSVVVTLILTVGVPYYIYTPLPAAIEEPLKLMLLDALFRAMLQVVRNKKKSYWRNHTLYCVSLTVISINE
uniref:Uncharacterized protein n=1 Tax=Hucho hucho TaxID=62062 RepID=A0A4W5R220_9TELE